MEQFLAHIRVGNFRGGRVVMGYMRSPQKRPDELVDNASEETRRKLPVAFVSEDDARAYIIRAKGRKVEQCQTPQCDHSALCGIYQLAALPTEQLLRGRGDVEQFLAQIQPKATESTMLVAGRKASKV